MYTNPIAEVASPDSGWIVTPDQATSLNAKYKFYCPDFDCTDSTRSLSLKTSTLGNRFFSHRPGYGHDIRPETLLHKLAIKWFEDKNEFEIPDYFQGDKQVAKQTIQLDVNETRLEYSQLKRHKPDVKLQAINGFPIAIEIVVTNDVSPEKMKLIKIFGLPTVRIELTTFYKTHQNKCRVDKGFIEANLTALLTDISRKTWVVPPVFDTLPETIPIETVPKHNQTDSPGCFIILPIIGLYWLLAWELCRLITA